MHYYQHNIKDYTHDTAHLTLEEDAVYRRLIDHYYDTEMPIPKETNRVIRRLRLGSHENIVSSILEEYFYLDGDCWRHKRIDREIEAYKQKSDTAKANGKKGGRPKKQQNKPEYNQDKTQVKPTENQAGFSGLSEKTQGKANQELLTNNHKPITKNQDNINNMSGTPDPASPDRVLDSEVHVPAKPNPKPKRKPKRPHLEDADRILGYLNAKAGRNFEHIDSNLKKIESILNVEGRTPALVEQVIDQKVREWGSDEKMSQYLRPETLFRESKFAQYVGQLGATRAKDQELEDWINGLDTQRTAHNTFDGVFKHVQ